MGNLGDAVKQTHKYSSFFNGVLSFDDLFKWLISSEEYSKKYLKRYFPIKLTKKQQTVIQKKQKIAINKIKKAKNVAKFLSIFPSISLVAVTGSLAIYNAKDDDDIDLMIITTTNSLWLTRLFVVPLLGFFFKRRHPQSILNCQLSIIHSDAFCLNLWLDQSSLLVPKNKQNLYTAHEVLQVLPLFDRGKVYHRFIKVNFWTKKYLANAYKLASSSFCHCDSPRCRCDEAGCARAAIHIDCFGSNTKLAMTTWLNGRVQNLCLGIFHYPLSILNYFAFQLQYLYMKKKITNETITLHAAYFHPRSFSSQIKNYLLGD